MQGLLRSEATGPHARNAVYRHPAPPPVPGPGRAVTVKAGWRVRRSCHVAVGPATCRAGPARVRLAEPANVVRQSNTMS